MTKCAVRRCACDRSCSCSERSTNDAERVRRSFQTRIRLRLAFPEGTACDHPAGRHVVLGSTDAPVATVIVLAWRLVDQLLDALEALSRSSSANPFDVTVVLDGADEP